MLPTVIVVLALAAFLVTLGSASSPPRTPLWIAVLLLSIIALLQVLPLK
jgi:hypothetical protein